MDLPCNQALRSTFHHPLAKRQDRRASGAVESVRYTAAILVFSFAALSSVNAAELPECDPHHLVDHSGDMVSVSYDESGEDDEILIIYPAISSAESASVNLDAILQGHSMVSRTLNLPLSIECGSGLCSSSLRFATMPGVTQVRFEILLTIETQCRMTVSKSVLLKLNRSEDAV